MNWLFPLYLAGAAAILAPILLHLRRRPPQDRVEFSSLLFLDAQTPVPVSKRRLENWLLLMLRCLSLILLALMFARPFLRSESATSSSSNRATLILIDRSASMRRDDLWKRAVAETNRTAQSAKITDRVALAVFDQKITPLWSFEQDRTAAPSRVAEISTRLVTETPSWSATRLDRALIDAIALFGSSTASLQKRILLVTDLQEGTHLDALRSIAWPSDLRLQVLRLDPATTDNLSLALAASEKDGSKEALIRLRLSNTRDSTLRDFKIAWQNAPNSDAIATQIPPGASRIFTAPPNATQATTLVLSGDKNDFDNRIFIAPPQPRVVRIHFLGDDATRQEAAAPLYYLARALQPTATLSPELTASLSLPAQSPDVLFVSGSTPTVETHTRLHGFLQQGGFLIHAVTSPDDTAFLRTLTGNKDLTIAEDRSDDYRMLAEINTRHPLLKPFADPKLRDFTKIRFWKHRIIQGLKTSSTLETLATFDNGLPAIVSARIGKGTLIILASGWHPSDSQLALSTKFVPLLYGWLAAAGFSHDPAATLLVGDSLPLDATQAHTVIDPEGKSHSLKAGESFITTQIGLHQVQTGARHQIIAVNLPPDEGRVLPLDPQKLTDYGIQLAFAAETGSAPSASEQQRLSAIETEQRQHAWWWILVVLLTILLLETALAGRSRRNAAAQSA